MKATLEFNLPEDAMDYKRANAALYLCRFIKEFDDYLRTQCKYMDTPDDILTVRQIWINMKLDNNIDLDKLLI